MSKEQLSINGSYKKTAFTKNDNIKHFGVMSSITVCLSTHFLIRNKDKSTISHHLHGCMCVGVSVCRLMFLSWTVPYLYHLSGVPCADYEGHPVSTRGVVTDSDEDGGTASPYHPPALDPRLTWRRPCRTDFVHLWFNSG